MKITKFGHCCLLIEEQGVRILTDPGEWTVAQNQVKNIDLVLITHEHSDHLHVDSLKTVLANNPQVKVFCNSSVGKIIDQEGIGHELLEHGQAKEHKGLVIEGHGENHAIIYEDFGRVQNTGFLIAGKLFYPGDALYNPQKLVDILALPVAGPWVKVSEFMEYAKAIKPRICFPVHDGYLNFKIFSHNGVPRAVLPKFGIEFKVLELEKETEV